MIVGERKPFDEIVKSLEGYSNVLILGCGTCVSVCMAGGEKEVEILASQLRMHAAKEGKELTITEATIQRQCDREYFEPAVETIEAAEVVLSMACGAGVQFFADLYADKPVLPALNTKFIGVAEREGVWSEKCAACSDCVLASTGGICPVTICPKSLLNGPCGGTNDGKCEVDPDKDCAWTLIYKRLERIGQLDNIREIFPPKNNEVQINPSKVVHDAYKEELS